MLYLWQLKPKERRTIMEVKSGAGTEIVGDAIEFNILIPETSGQKRC